MPAAPIALGDVVQVIIGSTAFGQQAALPAILVTVVNGALIMGFYILWIEAQRSKATSCCGG